MRGRNLDGTTLETSDPLSSVLIPTTENSMTEGFLYHHSPSDLHGETETEKERNLAIGLPPLREIDLPPEVAVELGMKEEAAEEEK